MLTNVCAKSRSEPEMKRRRSNLWIGQWRSRVMTPRSGHAWKLYASIVFKPDRPPKPEEVARVNDIFKKAADRAGDDAAALKDVADYYASTQQIKEAIPLYLRLLELVPDDINAREKLATGFVLTNQREKAVEMLEAIIKE